MLHQEHAVLPLPESLRLHLFPCFSKLHLTTYMLCACAVCHSDCRRDLKMGRGYGKLFMTADGMLVARVWQRPAFSDRVDIIMEEYMRLEQNGEVIVDKMTCLHVSDSRTRQPCCCLRCNALHDRQRSDVLSRMRSNAC
jgi:hypothetical protein